jgi:DNA-binding CsgD family transcriptional regulator
MPKNKAEQFIQNMMNKFKNRLTYDSTTGAIAQQKSVHTMIEDYWIPRGSEDGRNTEITTLPGGQNLDQIDDIQYFRRELYKSLLLPPSRLNSEQSSMVSFGRMGEITRDELIFYKFIQKLQNNFASLLLDVLSIQLDLKGIIKKAEFDDIRPDISIRWTVDNYFEELKRADIDQRRIEQIQAIEPYIGKYFSHEYVNKNILCRTEDQVEDMMAKMDEESDIYPVSHEGLESEDTAQPQQQVSQNPVMTSRETEILGLLKRNKGMADIAKELGISKSTVFAHKLRLSKKYGIKFNTK